MLKPNISTSFLLGYELNSSIGNTDISSIGDGSVTGAINELNTDLTRKQDKISTVTSNLLATMTASGQTVSFTLNPNAQYLTLGFSGNNIGNGTIFIPASFVRSLDTGLVSLYLTNNVYPVGSFGFNCLCHLYANKITLVSMSTGTSAANVFVRLAEHI